MLRTSPDTQRMRSPDPRPSSVLRFMLASCVCLLCITCPIGMCRSPGGRRHLTGTAPPPSGHVQTTSHKLATTRNGSHHLVHARPIRLGFCPSFVPAWFVSRGVSVFVGGWVGGSSSPWTGIALTLLRRSDHPTLQCNRHRSHGCPGPQSSRSHLSCCSSKS